MPRSTSLLLVFLLAACDERRTTRDAFVETDDAASIDAPARDVFDGPDSGRTDTDLNPDAARLLTDAGADAPSIDASRAPDARSTIDAFAASRTLACSPIVPPDASSGIVFSTNFWPGFRFQVSSATRARRVGLQLAPDRAGTFFAAIVRLSSESDTPDAADLSGTDVVARIDVSTPAAARAIVVDAPADVALDAGWYALVFGTDAVGGTLPSAGGGGCTSGSGFPFSIRQTDGMLILQGAEPHLFVEVSP
jgi:hypothetical protein